MDKLVEACRIVKSKRNEFACKISMEQFEIIDQVEHAYFLARLDEGEIVSNGFKNVKIASEIVETFN